MIQFLILLRKSFFVTLLDVDNAIYMTSIVKGLPQQKHRQAIAWGTFSEFIGRIVLIGLLGAFLRQNEALFTLFEIEFTPDAISLFIAGSFLIVKSSHELYLYSRDLEGTQQLRRTAEKFPLLMLEMTIVNLILSLDTIIVVASRAQDFPSIIFIFLMSGVIRLFAIDKVATLIDRYPSVNIVILVLLILIGFELFLQGLWFEFPEEIFNVAILLAILIAIVDSRRRSNTKSLKRNFIRRQ
ncbi:MAG: hypothetical protein AB4040_20190 [Synechococcus sp.]